MTAISDLTGKPDLTPEKPAVRLPTKGFLGYVTEIGELIEFFGQTIRQLPRSAKYTSELFRHVSEMVIGTSPLLFVMYIFMGIVTINTGYFLLFPLGASDYIGAIGAFGIHVSAVIMFGYVFTSKVCGGFVAQLGAMRINQEIEAFDSTGVDPMRYVVGTRVLATILYIPIATVVGLLGYTAGCYLDAIFILHATNIAGYFEFHWLSQGMTDQLFVLTTVALTAFFTSVTACFYGMRTKGGPDAVGDSVAQAVKLNLVIANLIGAFTVILWYAGKVGVPIGG